MLNLYIIVGVQHRGWEPKTAAKIYAQMVAEVPSIQSGLIIIDATYESDVAAFASVPFRIGREARSKEEPHAGKIYTEAFGSGRGALKGAIFPGSTGEADNRVMAFTFRFATRMLAFFLQRHAGRP